MTTEDCLINFQMSCQFLYCHSREQVQGLRINLLSLINKLLLDKIWNFKNLPHLKNSSRHRPVNKWNKLII